MMAGRRARLYLKGRTGPILVVVVDLLKWGIRVPEPPYVYYWSKIEKLEWAD